MKTKLTFAIVIAVVLSLTACASYQPIIDARGVDQNRYRTDLSECQQYASQVDPTLHSAIGAGGGAVLGAAIGAILGNRRSAGQGAAAYGLLGAGAGGVEGAGARRNIIINCLKGRGYHVLY